MQLADSRDVSVMLTWMNYAGVGSKKTEGSYNRSFQRQVYFKENDLGGDRDHDDGDDGDDGADCDDDNDEHESGRGRHHVKGVPFKVVGVELKHNQKQVCGKEKVASSAHCLS